MLLMFKRYFLTEDKQLMTVPVAVQSEMVSCIEPSTEFEDATVLMFSTGLVYTVDESFKSVCAKFDGGGIMEDWVSCRNFLPDEDDDYIVTLSGNGYNGRMADIDAYSNGKWKSFGKRVVAWMPFPEPYKD